MAEKKAEPQHKAWADLSKAEQEQIKKDLKNLNGGDKPKQQQRQSSFNLKGYARCELSATDKAAYRAWEPEHAVGESLDSVLKLVDSGYLFKLGESGTGYQASMSAANTNSAWDGYVLTAHASNAERAVMLLVYKHEVLMESDWSAFLGDDSEDGFR